ncbi:hypothetical protein GCK72_015699 [Caenorhabditis remanei]|uniref:DUF7930 domain-containing protein n=1 Tax=Caenorhabditis remanei TaxID=31234 RepID=A0A6A5GUT2_CAERE|nr:hypothetical protein GCK72_015699 [Caenorhabditis remanei]KAF1759238.1 hypothetical protein GCK72_015699 [Caenorhabditis remanei]
MSNGEITGLISKLEDAFAYATTELGTVFIPLAAARNKNETLLSLKDMFEYNEEIRLTVVKQPKPKNNCEFLAKTVRKAGTVASTSKRSEEIFGPLLARVTSTTDSFAFANADGYGTIFIPGDAFDKTVVRSVHNYISHKNHVIVRIKEQIERKGCKYVAIEAFKHLEPEKEEEVVAIQKSEMIISHGIVLEVGPMEVHVFDEKNQAEVYCHMLTYTGGIRNAEMPKSLLEVINVNEHVMFKAKRTSDTRFDAIDWKPVENYEELEIPVKKNTSDSFQQTAPCTISMLLRSFLSRNPSAMEEYSGILHLIPDYALPDEYLMVRDSHRFEGTKWEDQ